MGKANITLKKMDIEILNNLSNPDAGKYIKNLISQMGSNLFPIIASETKRFIKPTIEEIQGYCFSINSNVNPSQFYDFYESKNWYVGKSKMKNWQAAVRTWERNRPKNEVVNQQKYGRMTQDNAMTAFLDASNVIIK